MGSFIGDIPRMFTSYINFATYDQQVVDGGTYVLLGGAVLIALLGLFAAYNGVIAVANGARRTMRLAARVGGMAPRPALAPAIASTAPSRRPAVQAR